MFLGNEKIVCDSSLDKHTDDKYSVTNAQPAKILNTISKMFEKKCKIFFDQ